MFWLGMILVLIWAQLPKVWRKWGFRILVISSIAANLVAGTLSGTRRRSAPRWWRAFLGEVAKGLLWLAYEGGGKATETALGKLSLSDDSDATEEEKQVAAFWATFLLLHLGGPDNLTAYALEDNTMSGRKGFETISGVVGAIFTIYNNTHRGGRSWALLLAASVVMLVPGAVRYWERAKALGKANLESMQEDSSSTSSDGDFETLKCKIRRAKSRRRSLRDGEALLLAQDLFPIWRHALVDSSVDPKSPRQEASQMILSPGPAPDKWGWESMCSVAEMELSLIYELLYTKAILARTWYYYLVRLLSPLFTAAAAFLFCSWHQQQPQQVVRGSFVRITYALLAITFLMDVAWLLRALGSTWAYAYFQAAGAGRSWWCRIHRVVVWLDPLRLLCIDPVSHRRWSGTIGRYNLLDECIARYRNKKDLQEESTSEWWPVSAPGDDKPKELRYLSKLPPCVKELVFNRVTKILQQAIDTEETKFGEEEGDKYTRVDIRTRWGDKAFRCAPKHVQDKFRSKKVNPFGQEFEEDVLLWHIATCMLLLLTNDVNRDAQKGKRRAIEVMSEYMMFLVAVRRKMLPGLALHSQLQATRETISDEACKRQKSNNKEELAEILRFARAVEPGEPLPKSEQIEGNEGTELLLHAVNIYFYVTGDEGPRSGDSIATPRAVVVVPDNMLDIIFNVWVDKLVYAAVRCSREAHADQLSKGGDLTTVLWMLIQHAGPFYIQKADNITFAPPPPPAPTSMMEEPPRQSPPKKPDPAPKMGEPATAPSPHPPPTAARPQVDVEPEPEPSHWPHPPPTAARPQVDVEPEPEPSHWPVPTMYPPSSGPYYPPPPTTPPPPCPVCPPYYNPPWLPVCPPPYYNPSCPPSCPWYPQCTLQHERPGEEHEEDREDEHEDSSSSSSSEDSESEE